LSDGHVLEADRLGKNIANGAVKGEEGRID
jgi:hypothetical protein